MAAGGRPAGADRANGSNRTLVVVAAVSFAALMAAGVAYVLADRSDGDGVCPPEDAPEEAAAQWEEPPPMRLEEDVDYAVEVTTDRGAFTIDLLEEEAPGTVNNFVFLANADFYDCTTFHRIIPDFVVQGGDPSGDGTGGPGYAIPDELPEAGNYEIGSVAMANAGPDTGGSQFFIITGPQGADLPPAYPLFGEVTDGMDVVEEIEAVGSPAGTPGEEVLMTSVEIIER